MAGETDPFDEFPETDAGRTKELEAELAGQKKLTGECLTKLQYLQADFENYRKQVEKEKASIIRHANENLIAELLIILDDFERALPSLESERDRQGIALIAKRYARILGGYGLQPIESMGQKFDPLFHEVCSTGESDADDGIIIEELGKGYRLKDKVIRPAKVKVAKKALKKPVESEGEVHG